MLGAVPLSGCSSAASGVRRVQPPLAPRSAALPSLSTESSTSSAPVRTRSRPNLTTLRDLARQLDGRLMLPKQAGYSPARLDYNPRYDGHRPAGIARCESVADVQRCLEMASITGIPVAARSGGHSYAGYSTPSNGLVIDLSEFAAVRANTDGTVRIGAGARLAAVYAALGRINRCLPGGSCPTVGISGLTLGGGVGFLTRAHGLTCDRLVAVEIVTPDGVTRHVRADHEPDLFWALRGGGGGNFGVVTLFTFRTAPASPAVSFFLQFAFAAAAEVLGAWQTWISSRPDELTAGCAINSPDRCVVSGLFLGRESVLAGHLNDLVRQAGAQPTVLQTIPTTVADAMYGFAGCTGLSAAQCSPDWTSNGTGLLGRATFTATSRILYRPTDPAAFVEALHGANVSVLLDPIDGTAGRVPVDATVFPHRHALATIQVYAAGRHRHLVSALRDGLGRLVGPWGYVNYIDPTQPRWAHAYYAANLPRLRAVARKYDPAHVLAFPQSVA